ncbi:hypothetical protein EI94DRAFT_1622960, partial [Lactarius quietus]
NPALQLISEAIAAFSENNATLIAAGLPTLRLKTIAGIIMVRSAPTFYKILMTQEVLASIASGVTPTPIIKVARLIPPVPFPDMLASDGMRPLDNRRIIFQCFKAFHQILVSY